MLDRLGHSRARAIVVPVLALAWMLLGAAGASAISAPIHIAGTGGEGVFIRPEPKTSRPAVGWIPEGASPDYNCFAWGQNVGGVPIWFDVNYGGATGYYASYYDDSSYHSNEELTAKYGVPLCGSTPAPSPSPSPAPSAPSGAGLVFTVFNAEGGIYYRYGPHWSETTATPGVGVYDGDQVELICGAFGDPVGPYADTAWSKVRNLSRPVGEGWVNEHYIDDGAPSNSFVAGEPMCGGTSGSAAPSGGSGGGGAFGGLRNGSLYFSPYAANPHGPNSTGQIKGDNPLGIGTNWVKAPSPANITLNLNEWDKDIDAKGCPALGSFVPAGLGAGQISTLASWSRARAAPFLFLKARPDLGAGVHYILLFDPGDQDEWDTAPCSKEYPLSNILREWLIRDPSNKLVVLAGELTADVGHTSVDGHGHAGIQDQLFVPLKRQPEPPGRHLRAQIVVCNYDHTSHPDVWIDFRSWINKPPITLGTCPNDPYDGRPPVSWNP